MAIKRFYQKIAHRRSPSRTLIDLRAFLRARLRHHKKTERGYLHYIHGIVAYADRNAQLVTIHVVKRQFCGARFVSVILAVGPRLLPEIEQELSNRGFVEMMIMPPKGLDCPVRQLHWQDSITPQAIAAGLPLKEGSLRNTHLVGGSVTMPSRVVFSPCPGDSTRS